MSDENQNNIPDDDGAAEEDEFESLSEDEKAAFEKIMAEIAEAENAGTAPVASSGSDSAPEADDDGSDQLSTASTGDESESLTQKNPEPVSPNQEQEQENDDDETLDSDQQAVLDQIMSDIEAKKDRNTPEADENNDDGDDDLSDDQQAALDQILAEIDSKKKNDSPQTPQEDETDEDDDPLSDDQQAALDQIMAEIGNKRKGSAVDDESDDDSGSVADEPELTEKEESAKKTGNGLSLEEFNNELSELLSPQEDDLESSPESPEAPPPEKTDAAAGDEFPIFQEVGPDNEPGNKPDDEPNDEPNDKIDRPHPEEKHHRPVQKKKSRLKKATMVASIAAVIVCMAAGAYWGYLVFSGKNRQPTILMEAPTSDTSVSSPSLTAQNDESTLQTPESANIRNDEPEQNVEAPNPLIALASKIALGRHQLEAKKAEIEDLKLYYKNGIDEERRNLDANLDRRQYRMLSQVEEDSEVMLALQSIQRRIAYMDKLEIPLNQIQQAIEELLFLERRAQMLAVLTRYTSGTPVSDFEFKASQRLQAHLEQIHELSVNDIESAKPSLKSIWDQLHQKSASHRQQESTQKDDPLNTAISKEICSGNYSRRYRITSLSARTATCLLNWRGKDLFLNELKELTPSVAKILAQWEGEWLSLNGLKELTPETAEHLAQWKGGRLSLNGLIRLSPRSTAALSQWKGEQLEMIGLLEIGPWKNYGTRLFLSEELKHRLEGH